MLKIVSSNRTEALLAVLVSKLQAQSGSPSGQGTDAETHCPQQAQHSRADPFAAWQMIVPSVAMRTLLQNHLAQHMGICANVRFSFLAQWLWAEVARLTPVAGQSPLAAQSLGWRIYAALEDPVLVSAHPRLAAWLANADAAMRFELCQQVAGLFDKYMTYRPQWMASWMAGRAVSVGDGGPDAVQDQRWQMALWQRIAADMALPGQHPFVDFLDQIKAVDSAGLAAKGIAPQVHIFGLPAIPPIYLRMLEQLSAHIDIHLYLVNPCQQYWFDIVDPKRLKHLAALGQEQHLEVGNRLLAMWGKQSRAYFELLFQDAAPVDDLPVFIMPQATTLLAQVQAAVLTLRELHEMDELHGLSPADAANLMADGSIEFHACHTLARELEVLQDRLLDRFNSPAAPTPSQVLVVVPDLEQAAPLIDAVFGNASGSRRIPYRITGLPASSANAVAVALLELMAIAGSRYPASAVVALLQNPLIGARFGITPSDVDVIVGWLPQTHTHWGLNGEQRARFNAPPSDRHTFRDGIARLVLGYALPGAVDQAFSGLLAPCNVEGEDSRTLARFDWFLRSLAKMEARLAEPARPPGWRSTLLDLVDQFINVGPEHVGELASTRAAIATLTSEMSSAGVGAVPLAVVRAALKDALDEPTRGGAPTGGVTFCALPSLRNIPYDMICMVGMSDGAFPSASRHAEFDLMAFAPQAGDRDKRQEERNLFLDLLLAARSALYISYTGRSVRDNAPLPPSVLVSDLLDTLAQATAADPTSRASRAAARAALVLEHPLQPFSEAYFDGQSDPRLFSFHAEYCAALQERRASQAQGQSPAAAALALAADPASAAASAHVAAPIPGISDEQQEQAEEQAIELLPVFFEQSLPPPDPQWRRVSPEQLIEFCKNPCQYLLRKRLRLQLADETDSIEDEERFLPDGLAPIKLAQRLLPRMLAGASAAETGQLAAAGLEYPSGQMGALLMASELASLASFAAALQEKMAAPVLPPVSNTLRLQIDGEEWVFEGALADVRENGLVRYRYANATVADHLAAWISHLFLCSCTGVAPRTQWLSRDGGFAFRPVAEPARILRQLLSLYRRGLQAPLHFFPKSAWESILKDDPAAARRKWISSDQSRGEDADPAYQLALRGDANPLNDEFDELTQTVLGTLKQYLEEEPS